MSTQELNETVDTENDMGIEICKYTCKYCSEKIGNLESHIACRKEGVLNFAHIKTIEEASYFLNRAREIDPQVKWTWNPTLIDK